MSYFDLVPTVFASFIAVAGAVSDAPAPADPKPVAKPMSCLNDAAKDAYASGKSYSGPKGVVKPCVER